MNRKIRVLHTFRRMDRGGAETFVMNIYRNIDREKVEFDFLCEMEDEGGYDEEIRELGGRIFHIAPQKKRPIGWLLKTIKFLKKTGPYDAIHIPNMFFSGFYCVAARIAGVKRIIVHSHNAGELRGSTISRRLYIWLMRFLINRLADIKASCGHDASEFLFGAKFGDKDVITINNGVDIRAFGCDFDVKSINEEFGLGEDKVIVNVARFDPVKNHSFFIELGNYVKRNKLKYKIVLVGDGKLRGDIEQSIKDDGLDDIIICTGLRTDINKILNRADVLVMPSLHEGFPVSVVEALASGTPCVLSKNIDHKVAIVPELVSFVGLDDDCDAWISEIERMSNLKIDRTRVDKKLREQGFDIKETAKYLEKVYCGESE